MAYRRKNLQKSPQDVAKNDGWKEGDKLPRMSKKRKLEWAFFLNHRNRITYNDICRKCQGDCKQSYCTSIIQCPNYSRKERKKKNE